MASVGHVAIGMLAGSGESNGGARARYATWRAMAAWSALSLLPDADVVGFAMGVRYGDPWGHRGATHSIVFALAVSTLAAAAAPVFRLARGRTWLIAAAVLISHGLLDAMTDGGLGVALLWPFDLTRYFAPWQPIPVAPIGLAMLSPRGLFVTLTEVILFAPLIIHAVRPRRMRWIAVPVWAAAVWLIASTDPVRQSALAVALREQTQYAPGFSEHAFRGVTIGQRDADVRRTVGAPVGEYWVYLLEMTPNDGQPL